jgi:UDP-N-acetylmuramoyl-L-alanyl-D-glutamate--2,6-diaminopimelate ligase
VAVFTNLTQDHLDYHQNLEEYFTAKRLLFEEDYNPGLKYVVTNRDDPFGRRLADLGTSKVVSFGTLEKSDVRLTSHKSTHEGLELDLEFFGRRLTLCSHLIGKHNLYNIMAAAAACSLLGVSDDSISSGISSLKSVPGRFERVPVEGALIIIVDFAHTPDALGNVIELAAQVSPNRVICVFGCGGDRDRGKRPLMGKIAVEKADIAIITSDNPRSEDPMSIIREIEKGIPAEATNFESIPDRVRAIHRALEVAEKGDLVLLAGKGHETYQEINGRKVDFDEREIVKEALCLN